MVYQGPFTAAIDVGCGSGQSTHILSPHFTSVTGLDISQAQITEATKLGTGTNVFFKVSGAEKLPFSECSLQLVTAGQACHWFDLPKFYEEVDRILVPGGVLALYGYAFPQPIYGDLTEKLYDIINYVYEKDTGGYWGSGRKDVDAAYSHQKFSIPYSSNTRDDTHYVDKSATVAELTGYITSWSGFQNFKAKNGDVAAQEILDRFQNRIMSTLNLTTSPEDTQLCLRFKFFLIMGRKPLS
ncbi:putative methyltransferase DDB_G0268948 [Homarus americanus]|uniref:putative methyltransferase DDB_G0268948 n=1 Tax=Homarus americanus TaxID=6706 RepID=UPI001C48CF7B|nr:putative methyltransferase DDB_G0268948 [Homarus americanus]